MNTLRHSYDENAIVRIVRVMSTFSSRGIFSDPFFPLFFGVYEVLRGDCGSVVMVLKEIVFIPGEVLLDEGNLWGVL